MGQVQKLLDDIESHVCCCAVLVLYLEAEESFFLAFYKTLFYLEYTTGLGYNTSLTIIHWEHTTNKV